MGAACRWPWAALLVLVGCGGPIPDPDTWTAASQAAVTTPDVVIEATDGSFRLSAGPPTRTPFVASDCPAKPTTGNYELGRRLGARPVRVHHPDVSKPIYGLLSICPLHPRASALAKRLYDIRVPGARVSDTSGGRVSFVFEPHGPSKKYADGSYRVPAWILWLSQTPFGGSGGL